MLKDQLQLYLDKLQSRRVDNRQQSSYAVDSTTRLKHMSVITDNAVCIVTLLNAEIFQAAATCLSDKHLVERSNMVKGHKLEKEVLLVKMKEYLEDELVMDGESMQYVGWIQC